jgi:hypothetical protein
MNEIRVEFATAKSVEQCASAFRGAAMKSYGVGRKLLGGLGALRGSGGGLEFFVPEHDAFSVLGSSPTWKAGVFVPGHSKLHGATKMAVHIYVVDEGSKRQVQLVGPYATGDKGSTERLLNGIRAGF